MKLFTSQSALTLCGWGVKAGINLWVAGKIA